MHALIPALLQGTVDETKLYSYLSAKGHPNRNKDGGLGRKFQEKTRHELVKKAFDFTDATLKLNDIHALKELGDAFVNPDKTQGIKKKNINKAAICYALIYYYGKQDVKQALVVEDALNQLSALYTGPFKEQCMTLHEPQMSEIEPAPAYFSVFVHQTISEFITEKRKAFKFFCDNHSAAVTHNITRPRLLISYDNHSAAEAKEVIAPTLNVPVSEKTALTDTTPTKSNAPTFATESKEEISAILNPAAPQPTLATDVTMTVVLDHKIDTEATLSKDAVETPPNVEQKTVSSLSLTADLHAESKTATPPTQESLTYEDMLISLAAADHLLTTQPNSVCADSIYRKAKQLELFTKLCNESLPLQQVIRLNSHMQAVQDGAEEDKQFNLARTERIFMSHYGNTTTWKNMRSAAKKAEIDKLKQKNPSGVLRDADFERYAERANQHSGRWYERLGNTKSHQYFCSMFSRESVKKKAAEVPQTAPAARKKLK